ncbi:DUF4282 domain-containing protein, partial [Hyphococcus sp.]|uniref:DUF4282 domain-containing protein n=1 Tax=Hyphococcus sp. TaxID=2038636 RepID=UPI00207F2DFF|nr:MAG: hypothetical protein DHS20C04_29970 [Marinicaulis sp.]
MGSIVSRFMNFDKLIATGLIKVFYWIGIVFILLGTLLGMFSGFAQGFMPGIGTIVIAPIGGLIGIIFWRFLCEIYIVIFGMYDRLGNIQDALGAKSKDAPTA